MQKYQYVKISFYNTKGTFKMTFMVSMREKSMHIKLMKYLIKIPYEVLSTK